MGYHDEDSSLDSDEAAGRIVQFALKLRALIEEEGRHTSGIGGALLGYGLGMMLGEGASEADLREQCERALAGLMAGAKVITDHEQKTFS